MDLEAEVIELKAALAANKAALAENNRRTRRLSLSNIVLAVVVLAFGGATAAYALAPANSVNSASIIDRSIGTPDVKVGAFAGQTILDNSMTTKDIKDNSLTGADINEDTLTVTPADNSVTSSEVQDDSLTGQDIIEGSLIPTCPDGLTSVADVCYSGPRGPADLQNALTDCLDEGLRLPTVSEGRAVAVHAQVPAGSDTWTDHLYHADGGPSGIIVNEDPGIGYAPAASNLGYRCVTTVGARP